MTAWDKQVGGSHYTSMKIQPLQLTYMVANGDSCFCKVAKYIARTKNTDDLQKAVDVIEKAKTLKHKRNTARSLVAVGEAKVPYLKLDKTSIQTTKANVESKQVHMPVV